MNKPDVQHVTILGARRRDGQPLRPQAHRIGLSSHGIRSSRPAASGDFAAFIVGDALKPSAAVEDALATVEIVLIALPDAPLALAAIPLVEARVSADALVIDTLSVKAPVAEILDSISVSGEYLSLNPMFAPSLGFAGQKIVAVKFRPGPRSVLFLQQLAAWGASLHDRTAEEHDRACAVMQVATHALLLLLGRIVGDSDLEPQALLEIAPPPHRLSLALVARILSAAPEVYWDIQKDNPLASEMRRQIAAALGDLDEIVRTGDATAFNQMLAHMRRKLQPQLASLGETAAAAIRSIDRTR